VSAVEVAAPKPTRLIARSFPVEDRFDLLDCVAADSFVWLAGDRGFVTSGVVATVAPDEAAEYVRMIHHEARPDAAASAGPRAVGALPFAGDGRLVVPADIVARDADGRAWRTRIDGAPSVLERTAPPRTFSVAASTGFARWQAQVGHALRLIAEGALEKVVLARTITVEADRPWNRSTVLDLLRRTQPGCMVYADGGFVGASPELLVRKRARAVTARPLAGTGTDAAALRRSEKDGREHRIVVDAVASALASHGTELQIEGPEALALADLSHLATTMTARSHIGTTVMDLVASLHPTPAVAGTPRRLALDTIAALESQPRGCYAGPCGWVDRNGDGEFVIALRGAMIDGRHATLHAGAGIVEGSDAEAEWRETQQKFMPMLQVLVRP
jgi:menaquinone-specific isochorismate synthase